MRLDRRIAAACALVLLGTACGGNVPAPDEPAAGAVVVPTRPTTVPATTSSPPVPVPSDGDRMLERSPLADLVEPVGDMRLDLDAPRREAGPAPIGLSIPAIRLDKSPVRAVGVEANREMEIPGGSEIGWYRWSPAPGHAGSSVLAAHIAWNGRDGVFRNLVDLDVGAVFTVHFDDGSERSFEITETAQYGKKDLPFDRVFSKDGDPTVVLITCGGDFTRALSSYNDNVVAYAEPL